MIPRPSPFTYTPTRRTQPYRQGQQQPSLALNAMQAGRPFHTPNPMDVSRQFQAGMGAPKEGSLGWHLLRLQQFYSSR